MCPFIEGSSRARRIPNVPCAGAAAVLAVALLFSSGCLTSQSTPPAPMIMATTVPPVLTGQAINQTLQVTGGTAPYMWSVEAGSTLPPGLMLSATGVLSGTVNVAGSYRFSVRVTDSSTPPQTATVEITVVVVAPLSISAALPNGVRDTAYSQNLGTSGGLAPLTFSITSGALPNGLMLNATTGTITGTPAAGGTFNFTVRVTDSVSPAQAASRTYSILILQITTTALSDGLVGQAYNQTLAAVGEVPPLAWTLASGSGPTPQGTMLNPDGSIAGIPTMAGTFNFTAQATDSDMPARTHTRALSITIAPAPLVITTLTLPNGVEGTAYNQGVSATGGLAPVTFAVTAGALPPGLMLNLATGAITGSPITGGAFTFSITATDSLNPAQTATQAFTVLILQITTAALPGGTVNQPYNQQLAVTGEIAPAGWTLAAGSGPLPPGLMITSAGVISGAPTASGTFNFVVQVSDSDVPVRVHVRPLSITVAAAAGLTITTLTLPNGTDGLVYNQTVGTMGGIAPLTFSLQPGFPLPQGVGLNPNTGAITGTPTQGGSFMFFVQVVDSSNPPLQAVQAYTVLILKIVTLNLPAGVIGQPYNQQLLLTGEVGAQPPNIPGPQAWALEANSGPLPPGLTLDAAGRISGTPTLAGTFSFTAQAVDSDMPPRTDVQDLSITIGSGTPLEVVNILEDDTAEPSSFLGNALIPSYKQYSISADGRYVAFTANEGRVLLRDTCKGNAPAGCVPNTTRVSAALPGGTQGLLAHTPSISADGRWVAFRSENNGFEDPNDPFMAFSSQFYIHDTCAGAPPGCVRHTIRIPERIDNSGIRGVSSPHSIGPVISADGRFVIFSVQSDSGLTPDLPTDNVPAVLIHDRDNDGNGIFDETGTTANFVVSFRPDGTLFDNSDFPMEAAISGDGLIVAMVSVVPDPGQPTHIFLNLRLGTLDLVDLVPPQNTANDSQPDLSADGFFLAFAFTDGSAQHVYRGCLGGNLCATNSDWLTMPVTSGFLGGLQPPSISASGRFIAFSHFSDELGVGNSPGTFDVFVWDACPGGGQTCTPELRSLTGFLPNGSHTLFGSFGPRLSGNAEFVVFVSANQFDAQFPAGPQRIFIASTGLSESQSIVPVITRIAPDSTSMKSKDRPVAIEGAGFVPGSVVIWNGEELPAIYVSPNKLILRLRATDLQASRSNAVAVRNPGSPHMSGVVSFNVQ